MNSEKLTSMSIKALVCGLIFLGIAFYGLFAGVAEGNSRPLFSWLIGWSFWMSIGVGFLFLTMIFYVFDAAWPIIIRRQIENAMGGFKWLAVIFIPLLAVAWGWGDDPGLLWNWMNPDALTTHGIIAEDGLFQNKKDYLNKEWFTVRFLLYFLVWGGLAYVLRKSSYSMDVDADVKWAHIPRKASAIGLFLCAIATTFAAVDWFMSIEYHWFSTIYGVWFFSESVRACLAMIVIMIYLLSTRGYLKGIVKQTHYYLTGNLMLTFTMFWAYISFSQYFLIYNANIPEETIWYQIRELTINGNASSWWGVSMCLIFGQFLVPFIMLLFYKVKVSPKIITGLAIWMLFTHLIDLYWNILPGRVIDEGAKFGYVLREFNVSLYDVSMVIGVGGVMLWSFLREASQHKAIPIHDPRILESINLKDKG